jgi:hypothetical protein
MRVIKIGFLFDIVTIHGISPSSHNVVVKQNTTIDWALGIMSVLVENNGAWYTIVVTPNKLFGALIPIVELISYLMSSIQY